MVFLYCFYFNTDVGFSNPVSCELDYAHEGVAPGVVHLGGGAGVEEADPVPLLQVQQAPRVAAYLHPSPSPLRADELWPVIDFYGESNLARLVQVTYLSIDQVESRTGHPNLPSTGQGEACCCS